MPYFNTKGPKLFSTFSLDEKEQENIDRFLEFLDKSHVGNIIYESTKRDKSKGGRPSYSPYNLFAAIIYAFSKHSGSLRKIEESIKYDVRFMYILDCERPSYVAISQFLNNIIVKKHHEIYTCLVKAFIDMTDLCIDDVFLDGTKFEANANKYKFVWKPTTFHRKLDEKIYKILSKYYPDVKEHLTSFELGNFINELLAKEHTKERIKDAKTLCSSLIKLVEYEEKESICGPDRNSYYKTDKDATAMCLKEDYYSGLGSNMHAAYNCQLIVSKGLILDYYVSQNRTDYYAFVPSLERFYVDFGFFPKRICADSGYGSAQNYKFLKENNIENYVKYGQREKERKGESIDIYSFNNEDQLVCLNNKIAQECKSYNNRKPKYGKCLYLIDNCKYCRYKKVCRDSLLNKDCAVRIFDVNIDSFKGREEARKNLLTRKGIEMRVNRSSQVEGAFGVIKQNMDFERFRRRGLKNVEMEIALISMGYLVRKIFSYFKGQFKCDYWTAPNDIVACEMPKVDKKHFKKKIRRKGKNEQLRTSFKRKDC